ncbi:hypothetical protein AVEN_60315-1 [Araneus ventricosus]|uniref:Uncharacterized protein n=1 Tax=Araneus ventricosus TaxID=182803 RepID=A0A4Y2GW63_ARAVE|nr:hypothetical protein AVEN_60315-1 [Araneus ventricosus]
MSGRSSLKSIRRFTLDGSAEFSDLQNSELCFQYVQIVQADDHQLRLDFANEFLIGLRGHQGPRSYFNGFLDVGIPESQSVLMKSADFMGF